MREILSPEMKQKLERKLHDLHGRRLPDCRFEAEAWLEAERACARITVQSRGKSLYYPMEACVPIEEDSKAIVEESLWLAFDFLGYYLDEYAGSDGEVLLPLDWKAFTFGEREVYARGWERNLALEEAADRFLAGEDVDVDSLPRRK